VSTITLDDFACVDPRALRDSLLRAGVPVDSWWGLPNQWCDVQGVQSGQGWLLLPRSALDVLDLDADHDLTFSLDASEIQGPPLPTLTVVHRSLHVVLATSASPGMRGDPNEPFLVELADRRRILHAVPIDGAYNVRSTPGGSAYFSATLSGGVTPWTWATMAADVWEAVETGAGSLGVFPGLPFTPSGTPENFSFWGWPALDALGAILGRIGCALNLDTQTDTFSIVRVAEEDAVNNAVLTARDGLRVWDDSFQYPVRGRVPETVRVLFPAHRLVPDLTGASPWHHVDEVSGPADAEPGTVAQVIDDMPALYDATGALTNGTALATRAAERASDFFRSALAPLLRRTWGVPLTDQGLRTGPLVKARRTGDRGAGLVTEAGWFPGLAGRNPFPAGQMGSGGSCTGGLFSEGGAGDDPLSTWCAPCFNAWHAGGQDAHLWSLGQLKQFFPLYYAGDLSGQWSGQTVTGLQTVPLCTTAPVLNQVLTAVALPPPAGLAAALAAGGSLASGAAQHYVVTGTDSTGETLQSVEVAITPSAGNLSVSLAWSQLPGASGYKIYRSVTSATYVSPCLLATLPSGATVSFLDDGTASLGTGAPLVTASALEACWEALPSFPPIVITVQDSTGAPSAGINILEFDHATGTLTQPVAGTMLYTPHDATGTQKGMVNLAINQILGQGDKIFSATGAGFGSSYVKVGYGTGDYVTNATGGAADSYNANVYCAYNVSNLGGPIVGLGANAHSGAVWCIGRNLGSVDHYSQVLYFDPQNNRTVHRAVDATGPTEVFSHVFYAAAYGVYSFGGVLGTYTPGVTGTLAPGAIVTGGIITSLGSGTYGTVTSVSGGTTGLTFGSPTTTPTLTGVLNQSNGGTGQTSLAAALDAAGGITASF
jgi:hypothetical protein